MAELEQKEAPWLGVVAPTDGAEKVEAAALIEVLRKAPIFSRSVLYTSATVRGVWSRPWTRLQLLCKEAGTGAAVQTCWLYQCFQV